MKLCARNASTLAALLLLPVLQALCPRLAPGVISGKVIPCRYLCIKINFFELPSIVLGTEKDGVLCSTLLLRRRGVCRHGGCIPFGTDEEIKPKGTFGKVILAVDKFASGSFRKKAPEAGIPFGPVVSVIGGGPESTTAEASETESNPLATAAAGVLAKRMGSALKNMFSGKSSGGSKSVSPGTGASSSNVPNEQSDANVAATSGGEAADFGGGPPIVPAPTSSTPAQEPNADAATSKTRAAAVDFGGGPPIVPDPASNTPAEQSNANTDTSNSRAVAVDFGGGPPTVPDTSSNTPAQQPNANTATSNSRAVAVDFGGGPPVVPPSTEGGENSEAPVSQTPRGASTSDTASRSGNAAGSGANVREPEFNPISARTPTPSSDTAITGGRPSLSPTSPSGLVEPMQGNSEVPAGGSGTSRLPDINGGSGSSTVPERPDVNGSPDITNKEQGSSSNQPQATRRGYKLGDFTASVGSGTRSATRNFFSRFRRSYMV